MDNIAIEGIVLSSLDYKEKSKIVYLYTKDGKISFRAIHSLNEKKGMLPLITTMNRVSVILTDTTFPRVIDYTLLDDYLSIKDDLKKSLWFSFILEIISKLPEDTAHDRVYNLLTRLMDLSKEYDGLILGVVFLIKMTYAFGVGPVLRKCVVCNNSDTAYFSIDDGGALCSTHYSNKKEVYPKDVLDMIRHIYYLDIYKENLDQIKDYDYLKLFRIITSYYNKHIDLYFKGVNSLIF